MNKTYLEFNIDQDDQEREGQVEEEPQLYRFDFRGAGETGGHWEVDGGQDHHADGVDLVDHTVLVRPPDIVGGLVDQVHQDGGENFRNDIFYN